MTNDERRNIDAVFTNEGAIDAGKCVWITDGGGRFYVVMGRFGSSIRADRVFKNGRVAGNCKYISFEDAIEIEAPGDGPLGTTGRTYHRLTPWTHAPVVKMSNEEKS